MRDIFMQEKKKQEIIDYCKQKGIDLINIRNMKKQGKTRIIVTFRCKGCGARYDMMWDNIKLQDFPGYCTKCAHKKSQVYRRLSAMDVVKKFEDYGYRVVTPIDKIKPKGKYKTLNQTKIEVENKFGYRFFTCYRTFCDKIDRFIKLNENQNDYYSGQHKYEEIISAYLDELNIPYKREFVFNDCRGRSNVVMKFDFCLFYTEPQKRMIIEVDERHHWEEKVQKRDRIKNYYCAQNNIPLLRIYYLDIKNSDKYKQLINDFLEQYAEK